MGYLRRAFLDDALQKIGALALAVGVWFIAFRHTTAEAEFPLVVRPLPEGAAATVPTNEILVRVPRGLTLVSPPAVILRLRGPYQDLSVLPSVGGFFDPGGDFDKEGRALVTEAQIRWNPPRLRDLIQSMVPPTLRLDFERLERREIGLDPRALEVTGRPAEGFGARLDRARFSPPAVTATAREKALARIGTDRPFRLAPLRLGGDEETVVRTLRIHPSLAAEGIEIEPESVIVTIPILPLPTEVRFRGRIETAAFGPGAAERLAAFRIPPEERERDFVLAFRGAPPLRNLNSETAADLVRLFVDLGEIPADAVAGQADSLELPIRTVLRRGPGAAESDPLEVRPADPTGRMTALVERLPPASSPSDGR